MPWSTQMVATVGLGTFRVGVLWTSCDPRNWCSKQFWLCFRRSLNSKGLTIAPAIPTSTPPYRTSYDTSTAVVPAICAYVIGELRWRKVSYFAHPMLFNSCTTPPFEFKTDESFVPLPPQLELYKKLKNVKARVKNRWLFCAVTAKAVDG